MIFYAIFLLFKLIYPLPIIHKFIKDIELCIAEFFVFKPYFHNDRAIYFIRAVAPRMAHAAVFVLFTVLSVTNFANTSPFSPASFFMTSSFLSPTRTVLKF